MSFRRSNIVDCDWYRTWHTVIVAVIVVRRPATRLYRILDEL